MTRENIESTNGLMKFAEMSSPNREYLWDCILNYRLSIMKLEYLLEMRRVVSQMIDGGATFSFSISTTKKDELDGQIVGASEVAKAAEVRLIDAMHNADLANQVTALLKAINKRY